MTPCEQILVWVVIKFWKELVLTTRCFDLAILLSKSSWEAVEEGLSEDMNILSSYLKDWRLKLSVEKTVATMFHLYNREATREINIMVDNARLQSQSSPTYLGVKLDRTLSFKQHLDSVKGKTTARAALIRRLAGTTWGATTKTLRISTEALVFPAAEYCAPVWSRSPHVQKLDAALNTALRTVSGCLWATPTNQLPVLAGIAPAAVRREAATLALARKAQLSESHVLHKVVMETPQRTRLKSRRPFATQAQELLRTTPADTSKASWMKARWRDQWKAAEPSRLHHYIEDPTDVPGQHLPRKEVDNPQSPEDRCGTFRCSNAEVGSHRQCPLRMWWSTTDCGTRDDQLPHIPATKWWSWLNWPRWHTGLACCNGAEGLRTYDRRRCFDQYALIVFRRCKSCKMVTLPEHPETVFLLTCCHSHENGKSM